MTPRRRAFIRATIAVLAAGCAATMADAPPSPPPSIDASKLFEIAIFPYASEVMYPFAVASVPRYRGGPAGIALAAWGDYQTARPGTPQEGAFTLFRPASGPAFQLLVGETHHSGRSSASIATGDFNGDGILDVAVVNVNTRVSRPLGIPAQIPQSAAGPGDVTIFLGDGRGGFRRAWTVPSVRPYPVGIAVADFDRNGVDDVVIGSNAPKRSGVSVLLFGPEGLKDTIHLDTGGAVSRSIVTGDFNGDDHPDFAVVNGGDPERPGTAGVTVFLSRPDKRYALPPPGRDSLLQFDVRFYEMPNLRPMAITARRLTGREHLDLAVLCAEQIVVFTGDGTGTFKEGERIPKIRAGGYNFQGIHAADLDQDARADLVFVESEPSTVTVLFGTGDGRFGRRLTLSSLDARLNQLVFGNPAIIDIDGDGRPDIVVPATSRAFLQAYLEQPAEALTRPDARGTLVVFFNRMRRALRPPNERRPETGREVRQPERPTEDPASPTHDLGLEMPDAAPRPSR